MHIVGIYSSCGNLYLAVIIVTFIFISFFNFLVRVGACCKTQAVVISKKKMAK